MAITCPGLLDKDCIHPSRFKLGRSGYTGAPQPKAIVLHKLIGMDPAAWENTLKSKLPDFQCPTQMPDGCSVLSYTKNPKSAHFLVNDRFILQYINLTGTAFGIDYFLHATWPDLNSLQPITDVNGPFIHVVIDGECASLLSQLLCCIGLDLGISLPILAASDLQSDRPEIEIPASLQETVDNCILSGGFEPLPSFHDLEDRLEVVEACCQSNTSDIITIKEDLQLVTNRVYIVEQKLEGIQNQVNQLLDITSVIPSLVNQVTILINQVTDILIRCCPKPATETCFQYQLKAGQEMLVTPNQCIWLNLPTKIKDRDNPNCTTGCCGPIVKPGPLWMVDLSKSDCSTCETWALEALVRFRLAEWCAGKRGQLWLVACGVKYLLAEKIATFTGTQVITLQGTFLLPAGCTDVHLQVCTDDDKITTAKIVEFADFRGCCAV